jgi:hypothetical protein
MIYLQDSAEMAVSNCPTDKHKHTADLKPHTHNSTFLLNVKNNTGNDSATSQET